MAKDIEEFLKMAAKRRQQQKQGGGTPSAGRRPATPPVQKPQPAAPPVRRLADADEILVIGDATPPDPYHQSVSEHVKSHIDTSALGVHASNLGEEVALADDKLDARLHRKFDHDVGHLDRSAASSALSETTSTTAKAFSPLANDLLEMLSSPQSIRQAILISEVLGRPKF